MSREPAGHGAMRRILGNFGLLLRGRGIAAVFMLAATVLAARHLGPADFGLVVLVHAYALFVRGLLNFQPFESVVRFGVPLHENDDREGLRRLLWLSVKVDIACALGAVALALAAAPVAGWLLDWERPIVLAALAYGGVLATTANGTAKGLLRLFDRFDLLGRQLTIGPLVRLIGVGLAWALNAGVSGFVLAWACGYACENLYLVHAGWREYRAHIGGRLRPPQPAPPHHEAFPGLARFLWVTYWQSNLDLVGKHLPTLLAGALLGSTGAGLFRLAQQLASVLAKPAVLIRQVVFLDQTRLHHRGDRGFARVTRLTALLAGVAGGVFVLLSLLFGEALLRLTVGEEFAAAAGLLTVLLFASSLELTSAPLRSAAYALGRAGALLRLYLVTTALYLVLFFTLSHAFGLIGTGLAAAAAALAALAGQIWLLRRRERH